jgi:hypothetical protein
MKFQTVGDEIVIGIVAMGAGSVVATVLIIQAKVTTRRLCGK